MKKFLLSCFIALGLGATAQTVVFEDSFESYTDFAITNVGDWTLTDVDMSPTYGFTGISFPEAYSAKSFQVFNATTTTPPMTATATSNWTARTGNKAMVCFAATDSANNDWLISPQVQLGSDGGTLSFWGKSCDSDYGNEKFKVYVSTTGTATGNFTAISAVVSTPADATWHEYTYDLSSYAGQQVYIAIQCTSDDQFGFAVDDFKVTSSASSGGADCDQGDDSNGFENGYQVGSGTDFRNADDFMVSSGNTLNVKTIELNVITMLGAADTVDFTFYNDDNGKPGTVAQTVTGLVPYSQNVIGSAFGYDVRTIYVDVDLNFAGGASGATYWMQPTLYAPDGAIGANFWEISSVGTLGSPINTSEANGPWTADADGMQGVFKLHCEHVDVPPPPPCSPNIGTVSVEPISRFVFAGIDNPSDPTVDGSPAIEDFTSISGDVDLEGTYDVALEGNTGGNYTNYFTVFVDWNQDGYFDGSDEMYEIGSIVNSTGADGQQATGSITVPATALSGTTKIRVLKNYNSSPTNPCGTYSFGQAEEYSLVVHGSVEPGADCDQGDDSNGFENGYQVGSGTDFRNADDFMVSSGNTLNVKTIELNVITMLGAADTVDFTFYNDDNGKPGTVAQTVTGLVPYSQNVIGSAFGYDVRTIYVDVDLNFAGGASGATYWMQPTLYAPDGAIGANFWEISSVGTLGSPINTSEANGPWTADADGMQGVFKLHCEHVDVPPPPPCSPNIGTVSVEPISRFVFAGIDNPSDPTVDGSPAIEDFTSISGDVNLEGTYDVALEGNTGGNYTNYFTVFVDWNQDGYFDGSDEMYEIGSIVNSTGADGQQATGSITVPATALVGTTKIRVLKNYNSSPTNPCGTYSFGQAEEYSLNVSSLAVADVSKQSVQVYPNPVNDVLNIKSPAKVKSVSVYSASGNMVGTYQLNADNQINLSKLTTGVYLVKITTETGTSTVKVIKK